MYNLQNLCTPIHRTHALTITVHPITSLAPIAVAPLSLAPPIPRTPYPSHPLSLAPPIPRTPYPSQSLHTCSVYIFMYIKFSTIITHIISSKLRNHCQPARPRCRRPRIRLCIGTTDSCRSCGPGACTDRRCGRGPPGRALPACRGR